MKKATVNQLHKMLVKNLSLFIESKNISIREFEQSVGWSNGYFGKINAGDISFSTMKLIAVFAQYPELNIHWLFTGKGYMKYDLRNVSPIDITDVGSIRTNLELLENPENNSKAVGDLKIQVHKLLAELENLREYVTYMHEEHQTFIDQLRSFPKNP